MLRRNRRAANAIEFALTMPVLLGLMSGLMDWGWYFHRQLAVDATVRDAIRIGAMVSSESTSTPEQVASDALVSAFAAQGFDGSMLLDVRRNGDIGQQTLHVGVEIPYSAPVGIIPVPATLRASQSLHLEDQES